FAGVGFGAKKASVDRHGRASVSLSCPAGSGGCSGQVTLTSASKAGGAKATTLGSARFKIAAGSTRKVKVKLKTAARKLLARRGKLKVHVRVDAQDAAGHRKASSRNVTLVG